MKRREFLLISGLAATLRPAPLRTSTQQADQSFEEIAALVTAKMAEYRVPGVGLGILKNGRTMTRGFGVTNLDDPQPVTPDTLFTIASISSRLSAGTTIIRAWAGVTTPPMV